MIELVARVVTGEEDRHLVLVEAPYADTGEPWTLFVNVDHYGANRRTLDQAYYWTLAAAQADCRERFGVSAEDWLAADTIRFGHIFRFDYGVTNQGVPQPYLLGFEGAKILFRLGEVQHLDGSGTPVLNVCGNREGLRRLAALLLLCADGQKYDPDFHIHLGRKPDESGDPPFLFGDLDVTLRAPRYLAALEDGSFREWSADVDLRTEQDADDERWRFRPDA